MLTDRSRMLPEEEQLWQRPVQMRGHEINKGLAPIESITASLISLLGRGFRPSDLDEA